MFAASKTAKAASAAAATDPQFPYVTMLLHGDGTNGAQNNTFLDSSTNNFTITRNGNTTQGTFSPYGSNWSNYFGGASDYLTMPDNANYVISGDFTVEAWIYPTSFAGTNGNIVLAQWPGSTATNQSFQFYVNSTGKVGLVYGIGATNAAVVGTSLSCTLNTWNHIAVTRSGTTVRYFVNGSVDSTTSTVSGAFNNSTGVMSVGRINASDSGYFSGYISNCRLVVGTALYTAAFTPSTTPLTAVSGTQVLVCQNNRFLDASSNNATITVGGSPSVQRFSPFSPTTAYSTSVIGGSGYFDGSGDYLSLSQQTALSYGTGDFTIEAWVYPTSLIDFYAVLDTRGPPSPSGSLPYIFGLRNSSGAYKVELFLSDPVRYLASTTVPLNAWTHIAVSRSSGTLRIFVNGAVDRTDTGVTGSIDAYAATQWVGAVFGPLYDLGYITNLRVVKGTAVYTSAFTPPTAPLTAVSNTQLLLNFTNAGILDNAMMNDLETVGNAQISTSVKKYGTGSMSFDGTDDRLTTASSPNIAFGTGDFTVEAWVYTNVLVGERGFIQTSATVGGLQTSYTNGVISTVAAGAGSYTFNCNIAGTNIGGSVPVTTGTWYHVAFTRSSGSVRLFINGTLAGGPTTITANLDGQNVCIGGYYNTSYLWNGYIDDLRITKGFARYTANFTPPTAAFPNN